MKKHSLVTNLKNPNLGIGYVAKCGKTKSDVIFGYCRDLLTVKNENLSEVDLSGAKKITVDKIKKLVEKGKKRPAAIIVGNELRELVSEMYLTTRTITVDDLKKYPVLSLDKFE